MPETTSVAPPSLTRSSRGIRAVKAMVSADPTLIDARSRTGDSAIQPLSTIAKRKL
jgi:hypothetical protein